MASSRIIVQSPSLETMFALGTPILAALLTMEVSRYHLDSVGNSVYNTASFWQFQFIQKKPIIGFPPLAGF